MVGSSAASRWAANLPLFVAGSLSIVAGGLVAAVTGPAGWEHGSWAAAFLVLVAGVAQVGVGAGQAYLAATARPVGFAAAECVVWNGACLAIIAGTVLSSPVTATIGSALLVAVLGSPAFAIAGSTHLNRQVIWSCRALLGGLLVSVPVGLALTWIRH